MEPVTTPETPKGAERLTDEKVRGIAALGFEDIPADGLPHINVSRRLHNEKVALAREVLELREEVKRLRWPKTTTGVLVSDELVAQLRAAPSEPVTMRICDPDPWGWLSFVMTRHDCPSPVPPKEET